MRDTRGLWEGTKEDILWTCSASTDCHRLNLPALAQNVLVLSSKAMWKSCGTDTKCPEMIRNYWFKNAEMMLAGPPHASQRQRAIGELLLDPVSGPWLFLTSLPHPAQASGLHVSTPGYLSLQQGGLGHPTALPAHGPTSRPSPLLREVPDAWG